MGGFGVSDADEEKHYTRGRIPETAQQLDDARTRRKTCIIKYAIERLFHMKRSKSQWTH